MTLSRDSMLWSLMIIGSMVGYLASMPPPLDWNWSQWMASTAALVGILAGKLATSPLAGKDDANKINLNIRNITPLILALALVLPLVGCATKAPVTKADAGIYQVLGTVQDVEMTLHTSGVIADDLHGRINQKLAGVLKVGRDFNRVVRDWPVGTPKPATVGLLALDISQGLQDVLAMLPPSETVSLLRLYLTSAIGLITPFIGS